MLPALRVISYVVSRCLLILLMLNTILGGLSAGWFAIVPFWNIDNFFRQKAFAYQLLYCANHTTILKRLYDSYNTTLAVWIFGYQRPYMNYRNPWYGMHCHFIMTGFSFRSTAMFAWFNRKQKTNHIAKVKSISLTF